MDDFDKILTLYPGYTLFFEEMPPKQKGIIIENEITLNKSASHEEQVQWLMEEIGHSKTSVGDISDYAPLSNAKQEYRARVWGLTHMVPKKVLKNFKKNKYDDDFEVADELGIKITYLHEAGEVYRLKEN